MVLMVVFKLCGIIFIDLFPWLLSLKTVKLIVIVLVLFVIYMRLVLLVFIVLVFFLLGLLEQATHHVCLLAETVLQIALISADGKLSLGCMLW